MQLLTYKGAEPRSMMQRIIDEQGSNARVVSLKEGRYGGVFGFFAKQGYILTVEVDDRRLASRHHGGRAASTSSTSDTETTAMDAFGSTSAFVSRLAEATEDVFDVDSNAGQRSFDDALESVTASMGSDPIAFAQQWAELNGMKEIETRTPDPTRALGVPTSPVDAGALDEVTDTLIRLRNAGYPPTLLAELMGNSPETAFSVEQAFSIVKPPPRLPRSAGSLVAIVGPAMRAIELATEVAVELRTDPGEIAVVTKDPATLEVGMTPSSTSAPSKSPATRSSASSRSAAARTAATPSKATRSNSSGSTATRPLRRRGDVAHQARPSFGPGLVAHDVETAIDLMPGWRRDRIGVVVIACDASVTTYPWVRSVLRAIMPSFVYLAARASTKSEDIRRGAQLIGGVDAILLDGLDESTTPLSVLGLDIPIARLDGRVADPKNWTRVIDALPSTVTEP